MEEQRNSKVGDALESLKNVPERDGHAAQIGKAHYMAQAYRIKNTISINEKMRHKGWNHQQWLSQIFQKERSPMFTALISALLAITLVFGGSGVTAVAAQSSEANDFLYPVKLFTEDVRLQLASDPSEVLELELQFLTRRTAELQNVIDEAINPPPMLLNRIQDEVNSALLLALNLPGDDAPQIMEQIRTQLQIQEQLLLGMQIGSEDPLMLQTHSMLQERLQLTDAGLEDPLMTQEQLRQTLQQQIQLQEQIEIQLQQQTQEQLQLQLQMQNEGESQGDPIQTSSPGTQQSNPSWGKTPEPQNGSGHGDGNK